MDQHSTFAEWYAAIAAYLDSLGYDIADGFRYNVDDMAQRRTRRHP